MMDVWTVAGIIFVVAVWFSQIVVLAGLSRAVGVLRQRVDWLEKHVGKDGWKKATSCETCEFWQPMDVEIDEDGVQKTGTCRRYAPHPRHGPAEDVEDWSWSYCRTTAGWWCGDSRQKEE